MLTDSIVLEYVKDRVMVPYQQLEIDDQKILQHIKHSALLEFSEHAPNLTKIYLNLEEPNIRTNRSNEYLIIDPDKCDIFNIVSVTQGFNDIIFGHPIMGAYSHSQLPDWALQTVTARDVHIFSDYLLTYEFIHPNTIRISPSQSFEGGVVVEYERMHPHFGTIEHKYQKYFLNLAAAYIKMFIGSIRKRFTNLSTPWGDLQLDGESLMAEGKEERDSTVESLKLIVPNIIIDVG